MHQFWNDWEKYRGAKIVIQRDSNETKKMYAGKLPQKSITVPASSIGS